MNDINDSKPSKLNDMIGQKIVLDQVKIAISAAKQDNKRMDHCLLTGAPGLGKSSLAKIIAEEMSTGFTEILGNVKTASDLNSTLLKMGNGCILHIDEAHLLSAELMTILYVVLDQKKIFVNTGKSIVQLSVQDFTLLLSTTDEHCLLQPLRDRMKLILRYDYYYDNEIQQIVSKRCEMLGWGELDLNIAENIAKIAHGTPRIALRFLEAARRCCRSAGEEKISLDHLQQSLQLQGIDELGLGPLEKNYMKLLIDGPQRLNILSSVIGTNNKTLSTITEPFLMRIGFHEISFSFSNFRVCSPRFCINRFNQP